MKLQTRLALAFGVLMLLTLAIAATVALQLRRIDTSARALVLDLHLTDQVSEWAGLTQLNLERALVIVRSGQLPALTSNLQPRMKETSTRVTAVQQQIEASADDAMRPLMADVAAQRNRYLDIRKALLAEPVGTDLTARVDSDMAPAAQAYMTALQNLENQVRQSAAAQAQALKDTAVAMQRIVWVLAGVALVLGGALGALVHRSVARTLGGDPVDVQRIAEAVARGQLNQRIDLRAGDESSLLATMKRMSERLAAMVITVRMSADAVANASTQISVGNENVASRTAQQASSLQQVNTNVTQFSAQVIESARHTNGADAHAREASQAAAQGGQVVAEFVTTMRSIHESSSRIADIISVIDGIAFQTNILALNAAVEAARAGDHGRGFAVVAAEVRTLAQRCGHAAGEIKTLIQHSVERVEQGNDIASNAGSTIDRMVASIQRVTETVGALHGQSTAQAGSAAEIRATMHQLDELTQHNACLVEESAAAAAHLREQATKLVDTVAVFETA